MDGIIFPSRSVNTMPKRRLGCDPARRAAPPELAKEHNAVISQIAKLLRLNLEVFEPRRPDQRVRVSTPDRFTAAS